jgi:predicted N-acetyltransferase YhbS
MRIRKSTPADNDALLELTRLTPMNGTISLRIDRDPVFEGLLTLRGEGETFVAVEDGHVVGCISVTYRSAFVNGVAEPVGYVADLKVHPSIRGGSCAFLLMKAVHDYAAQHESDLYLCVVAEGNDAVPSLLVGRATLPPFQPLGKFLVYSMLPKRRPLKRSTYDVDRLSENDVPAVCAFINERNASLLFSPLLQPRDFHANEAQYEENSITLVARANGDIVATLTAIDTGNVKANVVIDMPLHLKVLTATLRSFGKIVPVVHLPKVGEAMRILYLRNAAVTPGYERALGVLISAIRNWAFTERYSFVTIGLHERDPRRRVLNRIPRFLFVSQAFVLSLRNHETRASSFSGSVPVEDFALV